MEKLLKSKRIDQVVSAVQPLLCEAFQVLEISALVDDFKFVEEKVEKGKNESKQWRDEVSAELNKLKVKVDDVITSNRNILDEMQELRKLFFPSGSNTLQTTSSQHAEEIATTEKKSKKGRKANGPRMAAQHLKEFIQEPKDLNHVTGDHPEN